MHFDAKYKAPKSEDVLKIIHAIQNQLIEKPISSLEAFKRIVSNWTAIPPDFVGACWNAEMTSRDGLVQWIFERLKLFSLDSETEELVDWIIGLLSHPDFSRPDALAAELEEFLLTHTAVRIGLHSLASMSKTSTLPLGFHFISLEIYYHGGCKAVCFSCTFNHSIKTSVKRALLHSPRPVRRQK